MSRETTYQIHPEAPGSTPSPASGLSSVDQELERLFQLDMANEERSACADTAEGQTPRK